MSANVTIRPLPIKRKKELIDKTVSDMFDELFTELSTRTKPHASEQVSRDNRNCYSSKLYDFVNSYHAFCRLCEQHFYSRTVADDINSFFQKHLNTSYHRQLRTATPFPDNVPIFTWEDLLHSGKCNICNLSGINSFVINSKFCVKRLMRHHICVWPWNQRETNEKLVRKLSLLKKYCGLNIFREKFLRTVKGKAVCLLCKVNLPWPEEKAACHLKSDEHYQKFCMFIWANFSFTPKDILNGFNLETVTRWLIVYEPPVGNHFVACNEPTACMNYTNNHESPYPVDKQSPSYSPVLIAMIIREIEIDLIHNNQCLLCNVEMESGHFSSSEHRAKATSLDESSFPPKNYAIYLQNKQKRLQPYMDMIDSYEKLTLELKRLRAPPLSPSQFIKSMLTKKLPLVDKVTAKVSDAEMFCHVCDQYLQKSCKKEHLESDDHTIQVEKWKEVRENLASERFVEPFMKIKNVIICLVCGAEIHTNNFFSHLKGGMHARKLETYTSLNTTIPISSAFKFREDFTCYCTICNSSLGKSGSLKDTLKEIKYHWPCPKLRKEGKMDLSGETEGAVLAEAADDPREDSGDETEVESTGAGKTEESRGEALEEAVKNDAQDESPKLENRVDNSELVDDGENKKRTAEVESPPAVVKESVSDGDKGLESSGCTTSDGTNSQPTAENGSGKEETAEEKKEAKNESGGDVEKSNSSSSQKEKKQGHDEKNEVLVIRGLPKKKRKYDIIYSLFKVFGKIQHVFFDSKSVVVAFAERGIAAAAALEARNILQESKLGAMVSERNLKKRKGKTAWEIVLDEGLINLLQDPQKLMDLVLCLTFQAVTASQSPVEAKREQLVCNMIIHSVLEKFPCCRCYPFGSRLTGLSLTNSDLDVFLDCGGMYEGFKNTTPIAEKNLVRTVAAALRRVGDVDDLIVVDSARVPIVSFHHKPTSLYCDISFKNGLSIQNSLLIKYLVSLDWRVKPLILFMKYWAKQNGLHGSPYFSSYALSMLVINYLEQVEPPILPTIERLQNSYVGRRVTIGGWDCSINISKSVLPKLENREPFPVLLSGLFEFYGNFDFDKNVVFPLTGKALPREAFSDAGKAKLPMCFKRHIINLPAPIENLVSDKLPICIVDPFDLSHVLTKSFTHQGLTQFTYFCQMSRQYLKKGMTGSSSQ